MELEEFSIFFNKELEKNNLKIDEKYYSSFFYYMKKILEWNEKINLTSITDEKMFIVKHFVDSLTVNRNIEGKNTVLDIGTGAGFPGIPIKIVNPEANVTVIDAVNKKLNVIREITNEMNVKKIEIVHSRAEDMAYNIKYREKYDVVVTRAVSNLTTILEYMLPFVKINGIAICMKGPNIETEIEESKNALEILGGKIETINHILIDNDYERNIIIVKKINMTPKKYPRKGGKALREPLR